MQHSQLMFMHYARELFCLRICTTFAEVLGSQYAAHACISLRRFSSASLRRYATVQLPPGTYRVLIATATAVYLDIIAIATDL